jgi:hypothetical protein
VPVIDNILSGHKLVMLSLSAALFPIWLC